LPQAGNAAYSPNGKFLAVTNYADDTDPLEIFSPDGKTLITVVKPGDPHGLTGIIPVFSPDGLIMAAQIAYGGSPTAWDTANWQPLENSTLHGRLDSLSSDGRILITRAADGAILLWGVLPE